LEGRRLTLRKITSFQRHAANENPTTATVGVDRRKAIAVVAVVAEQYGLIVIEDDA
jgi:DNA-binding transcriptional MocR family regulator